MLTQSRLLVGVVASASLLAMGIRAAPANKPLSPVEQPPRLSTPPLNFRAIRATVSGLSVRVNWTPYVGSRPAARYQVFRGADLLGEVFFPDTSYMDSTLRDNTTYVYQVKAIGAPQTLNVIPGVGPANQQGGVIQSPVLDTSNPLTVSTPRLLPPRSVTVVVNAANPASFNISWAAAPAAQTYNVVRNGIFLGRLAGAFTDTPPHPGWYTYAIASVANEAGGDSISGLSLPVTIHNGPFTVVALGDSIVWGQGVTDAHKFTSLATAAIGASLAYPAKLTSFAHSGAHLLPQPLDPPSLVSQLENVSATKLLSAMQSMEPLGEVPNPYPTIYYQSMIIGPQVLDPMDVDLIIMDGCANDVGIEAVLDPTQQDAALLRAIDQHCGTEMTATLQATHAKYQRAKIIVTGYFPMVSKLSDLTFLNALANAVGVPAGSIAGATGGSILPLVGVPIDPLTGTVIGVLAGAIAGATAPTAYRDKAVQHSTVFGMETTTQLTRAVNALNANAPNTVRIALLPLRDLNAYASPQSWLWLIPTDLYPPKDEMFDKRQAECTSLRNALSASDYVLCIEASMGHPNLLGAQQYSAAIQAEAARFLPDWRKSLALTQTASQ